jgi:hypothetical protein
MRQWTTPVFEEIDLNGECTAYAGAERADSLSRVLGTVTDRIAPAETPAAEAGAPKARTASPSRCTKR